MVASGEDERQVKKVNLKGFKSRQNSALPTTHIFLTLLHFLSTKNFLPPSHLNSNLTRLDPLPDGTLFPHISFIPDLLDPLQLSVLYTGTYREKSDCKIARRYC